MTTRREFVRSLAGAVMAAGGAAGLTSCVQPRPGRINRPSFARSPVLVPAHPWVYAATMPDYDVTPILDQVFADMRYAGLDGIELMHNVLRPSDAVERIGNLAVKHRLPVVGTSFGANFWDRREHSAILADADCVITHLAALGGRTLGVSVGAAPGPKTPAQLDAQAELLQHVLRICSAHDVVLNLHNHTYEVANDLHDLRGTLARVPEARLGPDLNWLVRGDVDPVWFVQHYHERIVFLHLRDQNADGRWSESLGEGAMDFDAIGRALHQVHFTGYATIELAHEPHFQLTRPLRQSLKLSREFVRRKFGW